MHARHRSPGNGYRSNTMGMGGVATASWISPEGSSMRGHGFYNSEYTNYNRGGFGCGQGRQFQPPQPPPHKGDVFLEAGKLATEYLVSKGLLPPHALPGKWQNGSLKNQVGDFQSVRSQEGDGLSLSADGRNKNYGSEWDRELGRSGSWSRRTRDSLDMEGYDDTSSGHKDEQQVGKEGGSGVWNSPSAEEPPKSDNSGDVESALERNKSIDDADAKKTTISSDIKKILVPEADVQPPHEPGDVKMSDAEGGEVKDENNSDGIEKQSAKDIAVEPLVEEDNQEDKNSSELLRLCRLTNVPTKTHSSLTDKSAKFDQDPVSIGKDTDETQLSKGSEADLEDAPVDGSSVGDLSNPSLNSKDIDSDVKNVPAVEEERRSLICQWARKLHKSYDFLREISNARARRK